MIKLHNKTDCDKPFLLLIHGWSFNSNIWQVTIDNLKHYYNIITLDLNGHGESLFNKSFENLEVYSKHITQTIESKLDSSTQKLDIHILGWSLGGLIGLHLKYYYPKFYKEIILCCTNPKFIADDTTWPYGIKPDIWTSFYNNILDNPKKTIKNFLLLQTANINHNLTIYKKLIKTVNIPSESDSDTACYNNYLAGLKWGTTILNNDYNNLLNAIDNNSILFMVGRLDQLVNKKLADYLNNNYPEIKTIIFNKSGHIPFITEPELFQNTITQFIH